MNLKVQFSKWTSN